MEGGESIYNETGLRLTFDKALKLTEIKLLSNYFSISRFREFQSLISLQKTFFSLKIDDNKVLSRGATS